MGPALPGGATARSTEGRLTRLRRRLVGEQIWMIGTHHPTIPREARHATLAHGSRHSIRGALWVREGRGWPPCWGGGVACAHTPNIASQPSAHHCLKSTTKTNTNQYIGQIRPLENHKAHKSAQAPKFRLGLPERSMGDLSGRPSRNFGAWALQTDFGQNIVFLGPWNCHTVLYLHLYTVRYFWVEVPTFLGLFIGTTFARAP